MTEFPPAELATQLAQIQAAQQTLTRQLFDRQHRLHVLARSVWQVQEEERKRIARDLHDGVGQTLTALKHQLQRLQAEGDETLRARLADSVELVQQALTDTRDLARLLRPQILDDLGLLPALRSLVRRQAERTHAVIDIHTENWPERLPNDIETLLFRICQEALNNAEKHAGANHVIVRLQQLSDQLQLTVEDNGCGFALPTVLTDTQRGLGLTAMQDRAVLFRGQLQVDSQLGQGTRIQVVLPWLATSAAEVGA